MLIAELGGLDGGLGQRGVHIEGRGGLRMSVLQPGEQQRVQRVQRGEGGQRRGNKRHALLTLLLFLGMMELLQEGVELGRRREGAGASATKPAVERAFVFAIEVKHLRQPCHRAQPAVLFQLVDVGDTLATEQVEQHQRLNQLACQPTLLPVETQ